MLHCTGELIVVRVSIFFTDAGHRLCSCSFESSNVLISRSSFSGKLYASPNIMRLLNTRPLSWHWSNLLCVKYIWRATTAHPLLTFSSENDLFSRSFITPWHLHRLGLFPCLRETYTCRQINYSLSLLVEDWYLLRLKQRCNNELFHRTSNNP